MRRPCAQFSTDKCVGFDLSFLPVTDVKPKAADKIGGWRDTSYRSASRIRLKPIVGGLHHAQEQTDAPPFPGDDRRLDRRHRNALCPPVAHAAGKLVDRLLGPLGARRQQRLEGAVRGMGREEQGRGLDRLHHLAGQQEPPDHRRRGAGAVGPRHLRLPDLGAARPRQTAGAGRRHHGRADQAATAPSTRPSNISAAPTAAGSRCRPASAARSRARARASTC